MKSIKEFIYYFRTCPFCKNWLTVDLDIPVPAAVEILKDKLLFKLYNKVGINDNVKEFEIDYNTNRVQSKHPFTFNTLAGIFQKIYFNDFSEPFKIEVRCYSCNSFRYWSSQIKYNKKTKKLQNIEIAGEKYQIHDTDKSNNKTSFIVFNNYKKKISTLLLHDQTIQQSTLLTNIEFIPFNKVNFNNISELKKQFRKLAILI